MIYRGFYSICIAFFVVWAGLSPPVVPANMPVAAESARGEISYYGLRLTGSTIPGMSLSPNRSTVGSNVQLSLTGFPPNCSIDLLWDRVHFMLVETIENTGYETATFQVPAKPKGVHTITAMCSETIAPTAAFEVIPRLKVLPGFAVRGASVNCSLRGYAARTIVLVRWKRGTTWFEVARVTTSSTGSANVNVNVPMWAPEGVNTIRGDALTSDGGRAQTSGLTVSAGIHAASASTNPSPAGASTAEVKNGSNSTTRPSIEPSETAIQFQTLVPTFSPSSSPTPSMTSTQIPSMTPTTVPTSAPTITPTPKEAAPTEEQSH